MPQEIVNRIHTNRATYVYVISTQTEDEESCASKSSFEEWSQHVLLLTDVSREYYVSQTKGTRLPFPFMMIIGKYVYQRCS